MYAPPRCPVPTVADHSEFISNVWAIKAINPLALLKWCGDGTKQLQLCEDEDVQRGRWLTVAAFSWRPHPHLRLSAWTPPSASNHLRYRAFLSRHCGNAAIINQSIVTFSFSNQLAVVVFFHRQAAAPRPPPLKTDALKLDSLTCPAVVVKRCLIAELSLSRCFQVWSMKQALLVKCWSC